MAKSPRFFCDNCGTEVGAELDRCPGCGRYFSAIRCPKCGFSGEEAQFRGGCPSCGYSSRSLSPKKPRRERPLSTRRSAKGDAWLYLAATAALLLLLTLLLFKLR